MAPMQLLRKSTRDSATNAAAQAEFNEKRRVWIPDDAEGFLPGWVKSQSGENQDATAEVVVASTGEARRIKVYDLSPMNPPQFDGVDDIADLTHLNEASVIHNLRSRYGAAAIYTYSGLFLISLNPYRSLPIYTPRIIAQYRTKRREENPPHIFAVAERAWQQIGEERESQSILITGESGAGKTENTKKVIQYLAAIASSTIPAEAESSSSALTRSKSISLAPSTGLPRSSSFKGKEAEEITPFPGSSSLGLLERQILQANPILEAFGNAQTMRNNNSSRFGKFIRIFFSPSGAIAGANIDWYLLEKSRVTTRAEGERCFHVFYQMLRGIKGTKLAERLLLQGGPEKYDFLNKSRREIDGVDDLAEWKLLKEALDVVGFDESEQFELFRMTAMILHIGNLVLTGGSSDQAHFPPESQPIAEKVCHLLGIPVSEFTKSVLRPKTKAGREWVTQSRSKRQAENELAALCKFMYEKTFGCMVERINKALDRPSAKALSIGVLDIAGFEIFESNSYEQLLINFTNEKLQQFFNFHMFTLEQEEYAREGIEWDYVNFGLDLQPTIELIESSQPVGILSCLDEECIMPKATDLTFTDKVHDLWETKKNMPPARPGGEKFRANRLREGFTVKHYAGDVEYRTDGWLEKNKDPINDAVAKLCAQSEIPAIAALFSEYAEDSASTGMVKRVKRGAFRTVGQRHKEQLGQLMSQLSATQPHFVRCIVPNSEKKPGKVQVHLVLDQLRCNGVLEGIRIARLGYPNRHSFAEFRSRYEVLTPGIIPQGYMDGRKAAEKIAEALELETNNYKIGATKIFFKAGVLAELEERRDNLLTDMFRRFQSAARMHVARRRIKKMMNRTQAVRTIQRNARVYIELRDWPWWSLYVKVRPLLAATKTDDELGRKEAELAMAKERAERDEKEKLRLEQLRGALLAEKNKVELDLSSEREVGKDRDRMLERSKRREGELLEKVKELEKDLDVLGQDREEAIGEAEKAKEKLSQVKLDFEALVAQATMLEKQSSDWRRREGELLKETKSRSSERSKLESEMVTLVRQVEDLKREVGTKDEAAKRAKERTELNMAELEKRLQLEKGKADSGSTHIGALKEDLRKAKMEVDELKEAVKRSEAMVDSKLREISILEARHKDSSKAQEASNRAKAALQVRMDTLQTELATRDQEKNDSSLVRRKLEKELDDLRKVMAAKSSEDIKRQEVDKSHEAEMTRLREQASSLQKALDDLRDSAQRRANQLRVDVEGLKTSHQAAQRDLTSAHAALQKTEGEMTRLRGQIDKVEERRRAIEGELRGVRDNLSAVTNDLKGMEIARDDVEKRWRDMQDGYNELEDAVLTIEAEKADWASKMEMTSRQLIEESSRRQHFEQRLHDSHVELASHRNTALEAERELAKAEGDIRSRDAEIALLRSRENKTIVEHVHVLEQAKKVTDRQLHEQVRENSRLNTVMKSMETHRNRLVADLEDVTRQVELLKAGRAKEARSARASLSAEDKDAKLALEDEKRARRVAEGRVTSLEKDLADQKRHFSTATSSPRKASGMEARLARKQDEHARLEQAYDNLAAQNTRLEGELADLRRIQARPPSTPKQSDSSRSELLRGLQQSHDALGRDMSDQLRRLDAQPLTPSRRHNSSISNGHALPPASPDLTAQKRTRQLEMEINGLRQQLEDEREEKEFLYNKLKEVGRDAGTAAAASGSGREPFPFEQAMYSHFRLKAKSLRSQLDHWLAMEDLQAQQSQSGVMRPSPSGAPFTEDVQKLKALLTQLDPDSSPLRTS